MLIPQIVLDCAAELNQLSEALVRDLARLGPFGTANRKPLVCCLGVEIAGWPRRVGKNAEQLQFAVGQSGTIMRCIAFRRGELFELIRPGMQIDLAVEPTINEYNGNRSVELEVREVRLPASVARATSP